MIIYVVPLHKRVNNSVFDVVQNNKICFKSCAKHGRHLYDLCFINLFPSLISQNWSQMFLYFQLNNNREIFDLLITSKNKTLSEINVAVRSIALSKIHSKIYLNFPWWLITFQHYLHKWQACKGSRYYHRISQYRPIMFIEPNNSPFSIPIYYA